MDNKMVELFWENPAKFIVGLFVAVAVLCILLVYMPEWFRIATGILFAVVAIKELAKVNAKEKAKQQIDENNKNNEN